MYLLAAAFSLPLGYFVISWSMNTYSFLSLYRPEQLFQEDPDLAATRETKGTEIKAEYDLSERQRQTLLDGGLLNHVKKAVS